MTKRAVLVLALSLGGCVATLSDQEPAEDDGTRTITAAGAPLIVANSPMVGVVGPGPGSTRIAWHAANLAQARVYVSKDGGPQQLMAIGRSGDVQVPLILAGSRYHFTVHNSAGGPALAAVVVDGRALPLVDTVVYRQAGGCTLRAKIFRNDNIATSWGSYRALLAIHGGGWYKRGDGLVNPDLILRATDAGFVVFAPEYRLIGDRDPSAPLACKNATWREIVSDVEAALVATYVHGKRWGCTSGKVTVLGGSAGAHLGAWLAFSPDDKTQWNKLRTSEMVRRAVLTAPPTDLGDLLAKRNTEYAAFDYRSVDDFIQSDPHDAVLLNSFPARIAHKTSTLPPVFILHGQRDDRVPWQQTMRVIQTIGLTDVQKTDPYRYTGKVGAAGRAHIFPFGTHNPHDHNCSGHPSPGQCRVVCHLRYQASVEEILTWLAH